MQQINFIGRLEAASNIFIIIEKKKTPFWIFLKILLMYCINNGKSKDNQFIR